MLKKLSSKPIFLYLFSFFIPFLIIVVALIGLHVTPFGDNTLVISDANGLYINYLGYVGRFVNGMESFTYSFEKGLGGNMMPHMGGTMSNPIFALIGLFEVKDYTVAFTWISVLNFCVCGLTMYILLADLFGHKRSNMIFSTSYALSGFLVANVFQIIFFSGCHALPLMVLGLRKIFQGKNPLLYILSLAYTMIGSFYFGFTLCVASALFFFVYLWMRKDSLKGRKLSVFLNYALSSFCGGLIPIVVWLPAFKGIMGGRLNQISVKAFSFWEKMPFVEIFSKLFTGANSTSQLVDGLPNIFIGLLPVVLVVLFFMNKQISRRMKVGAALVLGFYLLGFYIIAFDMLLHGGTTTNWFNFRYSYIFSFVLLLIAAYEWQYIDELKFRELKYAFAGLVIATFVVFSKRYEYVMGSEVLLDFVLLLVIFLAFRLYKLKPQFNPKHTFELVTILIVSLSLFFNYTISTKNIMDWGIKESEYQETVNAVNPLIFGLKLGDHSFYRMEVNKQRSATLGNDPMLYGYYGVGHGGSNERNFVREELSKLGIAWYDMRNYYAQGIPAATDALLGIKYLIANEDISTEKDYVRMTDMEKMGLATGNETYDSYQSDYALPIGFVANHSVNELELNYDDLFDNLNQVWRSITGDEKLAFVEEDNISFRTVNLNDTEEMNAEDARRIVKEYDEKSKNTDVTDAVAGNDATGQNAAAPKTEVESVSESVSEEDALETHSIMDRRPEFASSVEFSFTAAQDGPVYVYHRAALSTTSGSYEPVVKYMGYYHKDELVKGYLLVQGDYVDQISFEEFAGRFRAAYADLDALRDMSETVTARSSSIERIKDSHLKGDMTLKEGQELLFTIPWDEGWTCYVDGQKTELTKVLGVFMAAEAAPGDHTYEMVYEPNGVIIGIRISLFAVIILILYLYLGRRWLNRISEKEDDDSNDKGRQSTGKAAVDNEISGIGIDNDIAHTKTIALTEGNTIKQKRLYGLDFIKIVATLIIVLHHYQLVHRVYYEHGINFFFGKFYFGWVVELFFVISGFVMYSYLNKIKEGLKFGEYIGNHYFRFQPLMAISVVVCYIAMLLFKRLFDMPWENIDYSWLEVVLSALGLHALWYVLLVNNPLWYIGVLFVSYCILFWTVWLSNKLNFPSFVGFIVIILAGIAIYSCGLNTFLLNERTARGMYSFFWGLILAGILKWKRPSKLVYICAMIVLIGFPFLIAFANEYVNAGINYTMTFLYYTAVILVFSSNSATEIFKGKFWRTLTNISYNAYVWHSPLFVLYAVIFFVVGVGPNFSNPVVMISMTIGIYLFAWLSSRLIDRPLSKMIFAKK